VGAGSEPRSGDARHPPGELLSDLPRNLRHALDHPLRREILRVLHTFNGRNTPEELAALLNGDPTQHQVDHHLLVLEEARLVERLNYRIEIWENRRARRSQADPSLLYTSLVADDPQVAVVLRSTAGEFGLGDHVPPG
jgi:DNA-binding transcriptional ArsR family regulator